MSGLLNVVSRLEKAGGKLIISGDRILYSIPKDDPESKALLEALKAEKQALISYLRAQSVIPAMPPGVRLIEWKLKEPPVAIETCAVVTDSTLFAKSTLAQLAIALAQPKRWVGWSVPELVERLTRVGVLVALEKSESSKV